MSGATLLLRTELAGHQETPAAPLVGPLRLLYTRVEVAESTTREAAIKEAKDALKDLGRYISGERVEPWVDEDGCLDGPVWHQQMAECIADAALAGRGQA